MNATLLTTAQAAEALGVTPSRIRQLVLEGAIPAEKVGRDLFLKASDVRAFRLPPRGRPPEKLSRKKRK